MMLLHCNALPSNDVGVKNVVSQLHTYFFDPGMLFVTQVGNKKLRCHECEMGVVFLVLMHLVFVDIYISCDLVRCRSGQGI